MGRIDGQGGVIAGRPEHGPVDCGECQPQAMAGRHALADVVQPDRDVVGLARLEWLGCSRVVPMLQVEDVVRDPPRCSIGRHIAQTHGDQCCGSV